MNGEGLEPTVLLWKCHSGCIMELCDESNNCTKFQFYTGQVRVVNFFVILHHCVHIVTSHLICINQNLESWQPRVLSQKKKSILHHFESSVEQANKFLST